MPSTAPSTPDHNDTTPRRMAMNRSFTVPSRLAPTSRTQPGPEIGAAEGIETLYVHPRANIVKFTTSGLSRPGSSSGSSRAKPSDGGGGLSWSSTTESTLAAGPLEIYRVPGSVSFLHSGALLHAILPRSQCWCVDGVSKFALRVLPETYYRIELPGETAVELELVEALKETLKKVLFFERTACPFARGFASEAPAEEGVDLEVRKGRRRSDGPAKRWTMNRPYSWMPEDGDMIRENIRREAGIEGSDEDHSDSAENSQYESNRTMEKPDETDLDQAKQDTPSKPPSRDLGSMRSVTAPPQLSKRLSVRARVQSVEVTEQQNSEDSRPRRVESRGSRIYQSIPTAMPPSPPESSAGAELHDREPVQEPRDEQDEQDESVGSQTPELEDQGEDNADIPFQLPSPKSRTASGAQQEILPTPAAPEVKSLPAHEPESTPASLPTNDERSAAPKAESLPVSEPDSVPTSIPTSNQPPAVHTSTPPPQQPTTAEQPLTTKPADPYAAIQARIRARRSIGTPPPFFKPTATSTSTSTASKTHSPSKPLTKQKPSTLRPKPSLTALAPSHSNPSLPTALLTKATTLFLGPPAHLVAMMLRIAARFTHGTFGSGSVFFVESPPGFERKVPGSFDVGDEGGEGLDGMVEGEWEEDDFGWALRSPVRVEEVRERSRGREGNE